MNTRRRTHANFRRGPSVNADEEMKPATGNVVHIPAKGCAPNVYPGQRIYRRSVPEPWVCGRQQADAFLTGFTFLYENGYTIAAEQEEVIAAMLPLADHTLDEAGYAAWLREHIERNIDNM
jgi:hypothetical protein